MNRLNLFEKSLFALVAILFCLLLSFRPIPDAASANDTVRYVADLHQYCSGAIEKALVTKNISYNFFYMVTSPACWVDSDRLFLFEVAAFLPLMFLLFAKWRNGTFLWACTLLFSVYGLELMTNAMRQGFAMLLFFGSLALLHRHRAAAFLLSALAVAAHTSVLAFIPLLLWIEGSRVNKKTILMIGPVLLLAATITFLTFQTAIIDWFVLADELRTIYMLIYADELKASFLLFMVAPLYFIYGLRRVFEKENISSAESRGILYSTALLAVSFIFSPYITYRFAIFTVAMQIFLVTISERHNQKVGVFALIGLLAHLVVMLVISDHFMALFYG